LASGKIEEYIKFEAGNLCMITGGNNRGRIGTIVHRHRHLGGFDIVNVKDSKGNTFATRIGNIFIIGKGNKTSITLPKDKGIKKTILEEKGIAIPAATTTHHWFHFLK